MTVKQLRDALEKFPDDAKAYGWDDGSVMIGGSDGMDIGYIADDDGNCRVKFFERISK